MRFAPLLIIISLLATGCDRRDSELRRKMIGAWSPDAYTNCTVTFAPDGSFTTKWTIVRTNAAMELVYQGTWRIQNGFHLVTITNASGYEPHEPVGTVERWKIMRADDRELVWQESGNTNLFTARRR